MAGIHAGRDRSPADEGRSGRDSLAERMGELARQLQQERDETAILARLVHVAVDMVPGVQQASISLVIGRKKIEVQASSGQMARETDALQERVGQGPCLNTVFDHPMVRVPDMATECRWPRFAAEASAMGAASMLVIRLFVHGEKLGALNLYSQDAHAFDDESEEIASLVTAHAAVVLAASQQVVQLRDAAATRDVIGQAKGILMERYKITAAHAFLLLAQASSRTKAKLIQVAEHLADSGELPSDEERPVKRR